MIVLLIISGLVAAGLIIGLVVTASAPLGYQDENGFHYGQPHGSPEPEAPRLPLPAAQPKFA